MTLREQLAAEQTRYAGLLAEAGPSDAERIRTRYRAVMQISIDLAFERITDAQAQAALDAWLAAE